MGPMRRQRLWPKDSGTIMALDSDDARGTAMQLVQAQKDLKANEDHKQSLETWIKWRMADASVCRIPGFGEITWKHAKASTEQVCDLSKLKAEFPDAFAATVAEKDKGGGRRFLVKPSVR